MNRKWIGINPKIIQSHGDVKLNLTQPEIEEQFKNSEEEYQNFIRLQQGWFYPSEISTAGMIPDFPRPNPAQKDAKEVSDALMNFKGDKKKKKKVRAGYSDPSRIISPKEDMMNFGDTRRLDENDFGIDNKIIDKLGERNFDKLQEEITDIVNKINAQLEIDGRTEKKVFVFTKSQVLSEIESMIPNDIARYFKAVCNSLFDFTDSRLVSFIFGKDNLRLEVEPVNKEGELL